MNVGLHSVQDLINGKRFEIPIYQRYYSWSKEQVKKLFDDIIAQNDNKKHFTGVFFLKTTNNGLDSKRYIIDGQQRLITIYLIVKALFSAKEESGFSSKWLNEDCFSRIFKTTNGELNIKLLGKDMNDFESIVFGCSSDINSELVSQSIIYKNYKLINFLIRDYIISRSSSIDDIYKKVMELSICVVEINNSDEDAQEIFESLNSKNEKLTQGNLLKNFLLMSLDESNLSTALRWWNDIEDNTNGDIDDFVSIFYMSKNYIICNKTNYYYRYKNYVYKELNSDKIKAIEELRRASALYSYIIQKKSHPNSKVNKQLVRLNEISITSCNTLLLRILSLQEFKKYSVDWCVEMIKIIEVYLIRKFLLNYKGNQIIPHAVGCKLIGNSEQEIYDIFHKYMFYNKEYNGCLEDITDKQLIDHIPNIAIYRSNKIAKFLLKSLEEKNNPESLLDISKLEIEHILPQNPKNKSKDIEYLKNIHTIGNLTLITKTKNKRIKNNDFNKKREQDYLTSNITITKELCNYNNFSINDVIERSKKIASKILEIWPILNK